MVFKKKGVAILVLILLLLTILPHLVASKAGTGTQIIFRVSTISPPDPDPDPEPLIPPGKTTGPFACNTKWLCTKWSDCTSKGTRERECEDLNDCKVATSSKPSEREECTYIPEKEPDPEPKEPKESTLQEITRPLARRAKTALPFVIGPLILVLAILTFLLFRQKSLAQKALGIIAAKPTENIVYLSPFKPKAKDFFKALLKKGYKGLALVKEPPRLFVKNLNLKEIYLQTQYLNYPSFYRITQVQKRIIDFISNLDKAVVYLEPVDYVVFYNSFEQTEKMIEAINKVIKSKDIKVIFQIDASSVEEVQYSNLKKITKSIYMKFNKQ